MTDLPKLADLDAARRDGAAFGLMVGKTTIAGMARVAEDPDQVGVVGLEGVDIVMARAERQANVTLNWSIVEAWMEAAACSFNDEIDHAARLLALDAVADLKH